MIKVVYVFLVQGLLARAFPAGRYDADSMTLDLSMLQPVLLEECNEFSGIVPASDSVAISANEACTQMLPKSEPSQMFLENDYDYDDMDSLSKIAVMGSILADSILAGKEAEIEEQLAEIDAFVESELAKTDLLVNTALTNAIITDLDGLINSDVIDMESQTAEMDAFIESELAKSEKLVQSIIKNDVLVSEVELATTRLLESLAVTRSEQQMAAKLIDAESLVKLELAKVDSFAESELTKVDSIVESELANVNSFVEFELAKVNSFVEAELGKVDSYLESELALTEAIESDLASWDLGVPMHGVAEFCGVVPTSGRAVGIGSTGYAPILPNLDETIEFVPKSETDVSIIGDVEFTGIVPVTGRTMIFGSTGFLEPNLDPIEVAPVVEIGGFHEAVPVSGQATIVGNAECPPLMSLNSPTVRNLIPLIETENLQHLECSSRHTELGRREYDVQKLHYTDEVLPPIDTLPNVNIKHKQFRVDEDIDKAPAEALIEGAVEFSGTARARGSTTLFAEFKCPPLLPTGETSDGRKYLWLSKRPRCTPIPPPPSRSRNANFPNLHRSGFPINPPYSADFPETVIMDSNQNYERLVDNEAANVQQDVPVIGDMHFEGIAPAFGTVSLTGHCSL